MKFNFILIAFASKTPPLTAEEINKERAHYRFAPLQENGLIFSADATLWHISATHINSLYPSREDIENWVDLIKKDNGFFLLALCKNEKQDLLEIFGKEDKLISLTDFQETHHLREMSSIGYDVLDPFTGISALSNIGYNKFESHVVRKSNLTTNRYGLLNSENDAEEFLKIIKNFSEEHAPYEVTEIHAQLPTRVKI